MRYTPLSDDAARKLPQLEHWTVEGGTIVRELRLPSFSDISNFVRDVIEVADRLDHHPDIDIRYPNRVVVRISTHAIGGLSTMDGDLAALIDEIARRCSGR